MVPPVSDLSSWPRRFYTDGHGAPGALWVVVGQFRALRLDSKRYRTEGLPDGLTMEKHLKGGSTFPDFVFGATWAEVAKADHPGLLDRARKAPEAVVIDGTIQRYDDLDYLRDLVGLFDRGAVAVCDVLAFKWWTRETFLHQLWQPRRPMPFQHISILQSPQHDGRVWLHTRGMRLFGRPDLSVWGVRPHEIESVVELINTVIGLFAEGADLADGSTLADGKVRFCLRGGLEDPAFHNHYLEVLR